jgi:hypothetical protein
MMEQVANHGNGTYEYIDNAKQIRKIFVCEKSKFYTVAQNPRWVQEGANVLFSCNIRNILMDLMYRHGDIKSLDVDLMSKNHGMKSIGVDYMN